MNGGSLMAVIRLTVYTDDPGGTLLELMGKLNQLEERDFDLKVDTDQSAPTPPEVPEEAVEEQETAPPRILRGPNAPRKHPHDPPPEYLP
jgi:hypothetical protein